MNEINGKTNGNGQEFQSIQRQLLLDLSQQLGSDLNQNKLCKSVAKIEKYENKLNKKFIQCFNGTVERIVDKLFNEIKSNELIFENNLSLNKTINQTVDNIIQKQTKIQDMNESIVEKSIDLNYIKSEESRLKPFRQLLVDNHIDSELIKNQLKQSLKKGTKTPHFR